MSQCVDLLDVFVNLKQGLAEPRFQSEPRQAWAEVRIPNQSLICASHRNLLNRETPDRASICQVLGPREEED